MANIRHLAKLARGKIKPARPSKITAKINRLVREGYTQAGFENPSNANAFANAWKVRGYKVKGWNSSGPTVENPRKRTINAYYVVAYKPKKRKHKG